MIAGVLLSILSQTGFAECNAKFDSIKHVYDDIESYDAQQHNGAKKQLLISILDGQSCQLHIILTTENQARLQGQFQSVPYQIRSDRQELVSTSISRLNLVNSSVDIELFIPPGTAVKAGSYSDRLEFKLYNASNQLLDEKQFEIQENIRPKTSISVLGYNSNVNTIYLGELISGKEYSMLPTFQVVTNSDIQLHIMSENRGKLVHSFYKGKYAINYLLNLDGEWLALNSEKVKAFSFRGETVFLLKLKLQLENFSRQAAGEYSDTIRFQISPLNY